MAFLRKNRRGFQVVGLVVALAVAFVLATVAINGASRATAVTNATITGKVLGPTGSPISFTCGGGMSEVPPGGGTPPPGGGTPPPGGSTTCGIWVMAMGGPGTPGYGANASTTDGSFSIAVERGRGYQIQFQGPPDQIGQYTFETKFVEIGASETTKDIGTITATEKQGRISGIVRNATTLVGVANARVSAFPMNFGGPGGGEGGGPQGPMMPSEATTGVDGSFTLRVNQGFYGVGLQSGPDSTYVYSGPPIEANCESDTCTVTGIIIPATLADATIHGAVVDTAGNPVFFPGGVGARPVGSTGFQEYNGPIMPVGTPPNQTSSYSIRVPSSTTQYTLTVRTPPGVNYSVQGDVTVTVTQNGTTTQNLTVAADTSSIFGKLVSDSGFAMSSCKTDGKDSNKFGGKRFGEVFAHNDKKGKFANAEIKEDCTFKMTLGAGEYFFGYHINAEGIVNRPLPPEPITVDANTDVEKNITVTAGDAKITGQVFAADGSPMGNVWVDAGNEGEVRKDFKSGGQEGGEGPKAGEFRGPGGAKDPEEMMKFCSQKKNEKECKDFKLPPGAEGPGGCTNMLECTQYCTKNPKICQEFDKGGSDQPSGQSTVLGQRVGLARYLTQGRAHVLAEDVKQDFKGPEFSENIIHMGTQAGPDGKFTLTVVSGHKYEVRANLPPEKNTGNAIPPKAVAVDMTTTKTANIVLQFKTAFGTMSGTVRMPDGSAADRFFIHYWTEAGEDGGAPGDQNGNYSLGYGQGKLHISVDSFVGNKGYRSDEEIVNITNQKTLSKNFQLKEQAFTVPSPVSQSVEEDEQATISLDDGTQISIPSGALGEDGPYTVSVTPTVDLKTTEDNDPVGAGYSITATDVNGLTVSEFASNVTITMKYDGDYVEQELGLNESLLESTFLDDTTGAYQEVSNTTKNADEDSITVLVDHFSDWAVVSPGGVNLKSVSVETKGKKTQITIDGAKKIMLPGKKANWNVGTSDFGGTDGQYIVVSNMTDSVAAKYRGTVLLYNTNGKLKKTWKPFAGFAGGLNQVVADLVAKSGSASDGTDDVAVAPATTGPAQAAIFNIKQNKKSKVTTGTGTGVTTLNTAELYAAGSANLTTLFNGTTSKAWKMSKGKYKEGADASSSLTVKNGKAEKKTSTPKVNKVTGGCSQSTAKTLTVKGKGFGAISDPIVLWNATSALAVQSFTDTQIVILVNPSAVDINATNTLTIVNGDGQAGVGIVSCGT